ncbi:MAG: hypothetical protein ACE5GE_13665 [Phycisphaerae bacterium]
MRQGVADSGSGLLGKRSICGCVLAVCAGCGPVWHLDFQSAENEARGQEKPLLIFYKAPLDRQSSLMEDAMEQGQAQAWLKGKALCMLVSEYPPHRKYVAQFGVIQPPALVLVHPDGTFHRYDGPADVERIGDFLTSAKPPGARPVINPQIPRTIDYRWEGNYEEAQAKARRQNREMLIVYKWWVSAESTELIATLESRPEVARHFTETINCLLDMDYLPNRIHVRQYGVTQVPSIILVHRDGTYHAHTGPMSADQMVRFVNSARRSRGKSPRTDFAQRMQTRAGYNWYTDFTRASAHARNRGQDLFVFYNSLYSDHSNRMARLLDRSDVANLFQDTVNCRLDFSVPGNRQLMTRYRVDRTPAFLIVRPDGTYYSRLGLLTRQDLMNLRKAAERPGSLPRRVGGSR